MGFCGWFPLAIFLNRLLSTTNSKGETVQSDYGGTAFGDGTFGDNLVKLTDARGKGTNFTFDLKAP